MKFPRKVVTHFFLILRVYCIQNNLLDFNVNEFLMVCEINYYPQRYSRFSDFFISFAAPQHFPNHENSLTVRLRCFEYHKPNEVKKSIMTFSCVFWNQFFTWVDEEWIQIIWYSTGPFQFPFLPVIFSNIPIFILRCNKTQLSSINFLL